jgi:hypothetical protein
MEDRPRGEMERIARAVGVGFPGVSEHRFDFVGLVPFQLDEHLIHPKEHHRRVTVGLMGIETELVVVEDDGQTLGACLS